MRTGTTVIVWIQAVLLMLAGMLPLARATDREDLGSDDLRIAGSPSDESSPTAATQVTGVRSEARRDGPRPAAGIPAGAADGVGTWLGAWAGSALSRGLGLAALGSRAPLATVIGGGALLGGAANAAVQYATTGRVDWGSVAASTVGSLLGMAVGGPALAVVGGIVGEVAYRGAKLLWNRMKSGRPSLSSGTSTRILTPQIASGRSEGR